MARRRGFPQARGRISIPKGKQWEAGPGQNPAGGAPVDTALASGTNTIIGQGITPSIGELTLLRTRGGAYAGMLDDANIGSGVVGVGIGIVSSEAFGIGATAVPSPLDQSNWSGWLYHMLIPFRLEATSVDVNQDLGMTFDRWQIDAKAMRKFGTNDVLFVAAEWDGTTNTVARINVLTRVLLQWAA